jgi:hypothetical protein
MAIEHRCLHGSALVPIHWDVSECFSARRTEIRHLEVNVA